MSYGMDGWNHDNDLVRRKDVMDSLVKEYNRRYILGERNGLKLAWIEKAVNEVDVAQQGKIQLPEGNATKGATSDSISRAAAIDAICNSGCGSKFCGLPCDDVAALKALPSAQPEQRWIPCSERLPEHGGRYLISVLDGINRRTTVAPYLPRCKAWAMNGRMAYWKVIAWMPLPEPYREVNE